MINPLSFACQVAEGVPGCSALYLATSDLLIPNQRWQNTFGTMSRLRDLQRLEIDVEELRNNILEQDKTDGEIMKPLDNESVRVLVITSIPDLPHMFFVFLRDETEAYQLARMRRDFIANVSHELRTPLAVVRGYVETLRDHRFQTPEYLNEFLPIIQENTERMNNLVIDLLDLTRLESASAIKLIPRSLESEILEAVSATQIHAEEKNIKLSMPHIDRVTVMADSTSFQRVLINLIENAIKYTHADGLVEVFTHLDIDVRDDQQTVTIHIRDNGQGIPTDEQERIFERFYRVRKAATGVRGSGLGLAIVKHALHLMGSEIHLESTPEKGSDFYFTLKTVKP